jgi:hypothetical protein
MAVGLAMDHVGIHILCPNGIFYVNLACFVAIWNILWLFDIFFPVLVRCTTKDLATLIYRYNVCMYIPSTVGSSERKKYPSFPGT